MKHTVINFIRQQTQSEQTVPSLLASLVSAAPWAYQKLPDDRDFGDPPKQDTGLSDSKPRH